MEMPCVVVQPCHLRVLLGAAGSLGSQAMYWSQVQRWEANLGPLTVALHQAEGMCLIKWLWRASLQPLPQTIHLFSPSGCLREGHRVFGTGLHYGAVSQGTSTGSWPCPSLLSHPTPHCRGSVLYLRGTHLQHPITSSAGLAPGL